jgi:hypothetical protein
MRYPLGHARCASARLWRGSNIPPGAFGRVTRMTANREGPRFSLRSVPSLPKHVRSSSIRCGKPLPCFRRRKCSGRTDQPRHPAPLHRAFLDCHIIAEPRTMTLKKKT